LSIYNEHIRSDILVLTETGHRSEKKITRLTGQTRTSTNGNNSGKAGVVNYFDRSILNVDKPQSYRDWITVQDVTIKHRDNDGFHHGCTLISCYIPCKQKNDHISRIEEEEATFYLLAIVETIMLSDKQRKLLIVGDFNNKTKYIKDQLEKYSIRFRSGNWQSTMIKDFDNLGKAQGKEKHYDAVFSNFNVDVSIHRPVTYDKVDHLAIKIKMQLPKVMRQPDILDST
jgi:hypothetical protein